MQCFGLYNRFWVAVKLLPMPLLLVSPGLTLWRFLWHGFSILSRRGLAGGVARDHSAWSLCKCLIRAYVSGFAGLPKIWQKRREVFRRRKISSGEFYRLVFKYRIGASRVRPPVRSISSIAAGAGCTGNCVMRSD